MKIKTYKTGYCIASSKASDKNAGWGSREYVINVFLVEYCKDKYILFDTGYSKYFYETTNKFPQNIYAKLTKVFIDQGEDIYSQLIADGININDIDYIVLSHFHADHIAGVRLFENSKFIYLKDAYEFVNKKKILFQIKSGYIRELLPEDFENRSVYINEFNTKIYDFNAIKLDFCDIYLIDLPGHARGQIGLYLKNGQDEIILCADAVWTLEEIKLKKFLPFFSFIIMDNKKKYLKTVKKLNAASKSCIIKCSHEDYNE